MIPLPWSSTGLHRTAIWVEEVLDESLGIYATQPTGHLELLARIEDYRLEDLRRVLVTDRSGVRLSTFRGSAFVLPVSLLGVTQPATRERRVRSLSFVERELKTADYPTWADRIETLLEDGPLSSSEIRDRLNPPQEDAGTIRYVIRLMATENRIVAATTSGTWRSDRTAFARWADWLPGVDVWSKPAEEARTELARLYLDRHGPATVEDFSWWAGLTKTQAQAGFDEVGAPLPGTEHWVTSPVAADDPPPLRLLPIWDTLFVTYRDRTRFLDDRHYPLVYDNDGNATSVVLIDGKAAGQWSLGSDDKQLEIRIAPFGSFTSEHVAAIHEEVDRIGQLIGSEEVTVVECAEPVDLTGAPRNRFMSPLKDATVR